MKQSIIIELEKSIATKEQRQVQCLHLITNNNESCFCFTGLIADLYIKKYPEKAQWVTLSVANGIKLMGIKTQDDIATCILPIEVREWAELETDEMTNLVSLNDSGITFENILGFIKNGNTLPSS